MVVVHSQARRSTTRRSSAVTKVERILGRATRVTTVVSPRPGTTISEDGRTAVVQAGAAKNANDMVRAADDLKGELAGAGGGASR